MGADHDRFLRQRPGPVQFADDVLQCDIAFVGFDLQADGPAGQVEAMRLGVVVDAALDVVQVAGVVGREHGLEDGAEDVENGQAAVRRPHGSVVEIEQVVAGLGRVGVVDEEDGGRLVLLGVGGLAAQRGRRLEAAGGFLVGGVRRVAQDDHDLVRGVDAGVIVVFSLGAGDSVAGEDDRGGELAAVAETHRVELDARFQLDFLALRPLEAKAGRLVEDIGGVRERLEVSPVEAGGFEAGLLELAGDVVGRLVDALRARAAAFQLVGRQVDNVSFKAIFGGLDGVFRGGGRDGGEEGQSQHKKHRPTGRPVGNDHGVGISGGKDFGAVTSMEAGASAVKRAIGRLCFGRRRSRTADTAAGVPRASAVR